MTWSSIAETFSTYFNAKLITLGGTTVTPKTLVTATVIMIVTIVVSRLLRRAILRVFQHRGVADKGTVGAVARLAHYAVLLIGLGIALQTAGFNLNALFAAGAVFAVGLGFAMQNIVQNFAAGVILLAERSIRPHDVLEVQGEVVKVVQMGIRTTIVRTRDGDHLIVPNSVLAQSTVTNFTLNESQLRLRANVGVVYSSDMAQVRQILERTAEQIPWRVKELPPLVLLTGFGNNSVDFEVSVWSADPWRSRPQLSELHEAIWWALKEEDVVIAFPQVDVHFDPPVHQGLARLSALAGGKA